MILVNSKAVQEANNFKNEYNFKETVTKIMQSGQQQTLCL
jgi:hypothetical protein